jgi:hypothetical protein
MMQPGGIARLIPFSYQNLSIFQETPASKSFPIYNSFSILASRIIKLLSLPIERCVTSTIWKRDQEAVICIIGVFMAYELV